MIHRRSTVYREADKAYLTRSSPHQSRPLERGIFTAAATFEAEMFDETQIGLLAFLVLVMAGFFHENCLRMVPSFAKTAWFKFVLLVLTVDLLVFTDECIATLAIFRSEIRSHFFKELKKNYILLLYEGYSWVITGLLHPSLLAGFLHFSLLFPKVVGDDPDKAGVLSVEAEPLAFCMTAILITSAAIFGFSFAGWVWRRVTWLSAPPRSEAELSELEDPQLAEFARHFVPRYVYSLCDTKLVRIYIFHHFVKLFSKQACLLPRKWF